MSSSYIIIIEILINGSSSYCMRVCYSPDFRARASSNASSTGRLSPIFSEQLSTADYGLDSVAEQGQADQLAGTLAQAVRLSQPLQTLESYGDVFLNNRPPPPPYSSLSIQSCPIHGYQGCSCFTLNQLDNTYIKQVRSKLKRSTVIAVTASDYRMKKRRFIFSPYCCEKWQCNTIIVFLLYWYNYG